MSVQGIRAFVEKHRWWVGVLVGAGLAFGWSMPVTPGRRMAYHERELRSLDARQDSLSKDHADIALYLRALVAVQCIDRPARETAMIGLPCEEVLRQGRGRVLQYEPHE